MKVSFILLSAALALVPGVASGDVVGCAGQVHSIELRSNGLLIGDWGYGYKGLCYLNQDANVNGVVTVKDTCSAYYATLLTAKTTHQQIVSYHNAGSCSSALAETDGYSHWMAVPPYSIILQDN